MAIKRVVSKELTASDRKRDWAALTWDDLTEWAGSRSVTRGRSYQQRGQVRNLTITDDGRLLATVVGGEIYATSVWLVAGKGGKSLQSTCSCPVGFDGCKHAVAVVAEYLQALAENRTIAKAEADDPRRAQSQRSFDADDSGFDEEDGQDEDEFVIDEHMADTRRSSSQRKRKGRVAKSTSAAVWKQRIEQHIRAKSRQELADLAWSLVQRFPEVYQEFRERLELAEGDVARLVADTRRQIHKITAEDGWRNSWDGEGHTPDYSKILHRLERLLDLGHADAVVSLGRELIDQGFEQIGRSHDQGETAEALLCCLPLICRALEQSSLSGPQRLLFAVEAELADDYSLIDDAFDAIFDTASAADWSALADEFRERLASQVSDADDSSRSYRRDQLSGYLLAALEKSGRQAEMLPIYEAEARANGSYERLVSFLISERQLDAAERWACEGIAATRSKLPGIARNLAAKLCELARSRKQWDIVASHAAVAFYSQPGYEGFKELISAARKAGVEEAVRAAAFAFLESGKIPFHAAPAKDAEKSAAGKRSAGKRATATTKGTIRVAMSDAIAAPQTPKLRIDPGWPLPMPPYLAALLPAENSSRNERQPHYDVLLDMAIREKRPDEVLHWYGKLAEPQPRSVWGYRRGDGYAERVAAAVAETHPEVSLKLYTAALNTHLPHADPGAYEAAGGYLKKLRPIYKSLDRLHEWERLVESIREQYRNRPRFLEVLDGLQSRTILQSARDRKGKRRV